MCYTLCLTSELFFSDLKFLFLGLTDKIVSAKSFQLDNSKFNRISISFCQNSVTDFFFLNSVGNFKMLLVSQLRVFLHLYIACVSWVIHQVGSKRLKWSTQDLHFMMVKVRNVLWECIFQYGGYMLATFLSEDEVQVPSL